MKTIKMLTLPTCNFCPKPAAYDAPMLGHSTWAYMCSDCFASRGSHTCGSQLVQMNDTESSYASSGTDVYDASLEASYMGSINLEELMKESLFDGVIEVVDGCTVEPDGKCCHGYSSPLLLAGLM